MLMSSFAKLTVALANLLEAEARALRGGVLKLCLRASLVFAGVMLVLGGLAFVLFGVRETLQSTYSVGTASLITGFGTIVVAVCWILLAMKAGAGGD